MNLSLSLHNFPDRGSLHNFPNRGCLMSIWVGGAGIGVASGAGRWRLETGGSGAITHASRRAVKPFLTRPFLTTWRRTRAWTGSNQARLTNICSVSSDACSVPSVHPAVPSGLAGTVNTDPVVNDRRSCRRPVRASRHPRLQSKGKVNDRRSCRRPAYQPPSPLTKAGKARTVRHGSELSFFVSFLHVSPGWKQAGGRSQCLLGIIARPDLI